MAESLYYKSSDSVLAAEKSFHIPEHGFRFSSDRKSHRKTIYIFDFEFRTVTTLSRGGTGGGEQAQVLPFSTMDQNVLEKMREKLVELGGDPPPLSQAMNKKGLTHQNVPAPAQKKGL